MISMSLFNPHLILHLLLLTVVTGEILRPRFYSETCPEAESITGGPDWEVKLGRKDSLTASQKDSDDIMPSPRANATFLIDLFKRFDLSVRDMVALSGSHSIGQGRCFSIMFRLYNQSGSGKPDPVIEPVYKKKLNKLCPLGGDENVTGDLDATPYVFDNQYFKDLVSGRGFLNSDQTLYTSRDEGEDTHDVHNTPSSPISSLISRDIEETQHLQTSSSSPLSTLFENGADVEIAASDDATCRIWYPGNVFVTNLCDGVEMVAVTLFADQKRVTVTADKIRHKPPADDREKKFEMMDNVEAFYSKGWGSGQVRMILGKNKFSVYLNSSMETLEFKASDLRIHREWLDGVWKMADENKETRVQTHFDIGANVEVASEDEDIYVKWYPRILLKTYIRNGVEMLKVEYSTWFRDKEKRTKKLLESVSIDSIRPQSPPGDTKGFELMDKVEAYHNDGWCSGKVHIILTDDIYSVRFNSFTEFIKFNLSDLRIHKEWVDGVWKMEKEQTQSVKPRQDDHAKNGKPVVGMKRKATAQPVDRLAFLQREEKRPIVPRNPPTPVTPEAILPIDPFVTPEFPLFSRHGYWMQLRCIHYYMPLYINGNKIEKDFFEYLDYAENNLKEKFLETVGYSYENLQKPDKKGIKILKGWVGEVVRDVDIVYGVVHERLVDHFIGVEIHLMENTITIFHCGIHKVKENPLIQKLAVLIPAIKLEMMNEEINFNDIIPFQDKKAEGLPKTKLPFNCGLIVVKMLECRSLGLKKMSNINDDTAMDLRSKLCCEIFDQFMDTDFQEGCRR
ncbi:hypothetical protein Bca52824_046175 [Brassica carinata]|uniref:peroxidase n=1 Tax=Brassica carinata TaxID=52824 RepID=A0A8X7RDV4_BRACI|nr:hypothetical protein Bca52824_046175 [Brassica carinata]